jgi:inhibitor of KinA
MLGFTPGFAYLGGMPSELATPRLVKPRVLIPAGSVGIAAAQTGIYPVESPGGWQLLGRTPLKVFNYERSEPFLLNAGDYLKFVPVSAEEYAAIEKAENSGGYRPKRYRKGA